MANKKRSIIITAILAAIICVVIILIFVLKPTNEPIIEPAKIDPRSFEEMFWDSETVDEAIETFQKKIDATENSEEKAELFLERSETLNTISGIKSVFKDQILSDALEADLLLKTPRTASILKNYYLNLEDEENFKYYERLFYNRIEKEIENE